MFCVLVVELPAGQMFGFLALLAQMSRDGYEAVRTEDA